MPAPLRSHIHVTALRHAGYIDRRAGSGSARITSAELAVLLYRSMHAAPQHVVALERRGPVHLVSGSQRQRGHCRQTAAGLEGVVGKVGLVQRAGP